MTWDIEKTKPESRKTAHGARNYTKNLGKHLETENHMSERAGSPFGKCESWWPKGHHTSI